MGPREGRGGSGSVNVNLGDTIYSDSEIPGTPVALRVACLDRIRDPSRTMLGERQYARFTAAIAAATATFKVVVNEVPIQQFYALPYDRWEGYEAERLKLIHFLQANVRNVVFLTTDTHANSSTTSGRRRSSRVGRSSRGSRRS